MKRAQKEDDVTLTIGQAVERRPECVERWPECESGAYDPRCCRFPKSCSCNVRPEKSAALAEHRNLADRLRDTALAWERYPSLCLLLNEAADQLEIAECQHRDHQAPRTPGGRRIALAEGNPYLMRDSDGRLIFDHEKIAEAMRAGAVTDDILEGNERV